MVMAPSLWGCPQFEVFIPPTIGFRAREGPWMDG